VGKCVTLDLLPIVDKVVQKDGHLPFLPAHYRGTAGHLQASNYDELSSKTLFLVSPKIMSSKCDVGRESLLVC
jgi:hypothetical protein